MEVEDGSKPAREGVTRALRFCAMESSIAPRDNRRNSGAVVSYLQELKMAWTMYLVKP